jgi:hypothetical protein
MIILNNRDLRTDDCRLRTHLTSTPSLLNLITSIGHDQTHLAQLVQRGSIIKISASFNSIASSGQTPTQHPQKSHLFGRISIISLPVFACLYIIRYLTLLLFSFCLAQVRCCFSSALIIWIHLL